MKLLMGVLVGLVATCGVAQAEVCESLSAKVSYETCVTSGNLTYLERPQYIWKNQTVGYSPIDVKPSDRIFNKFPARGLCIALGFKDASADYYGKLEAGPQYGNLMKFNRDGFAYITKATSAKNSKTVFSLTCIK